MYLIFIYLFFLVFVSILLESCSTKNHEMRILSENSGPKNSKACVLSIRVLFTGFTSL